MEYKIDSNFGTFKKDATNFQSWTLKIIQILSFINISSWLLQKLFSRCWMIGSNFSCSMIYRICGKLETKSNLSEYMKENSISQYTDPLETLVHVN